MTDLNQLITWLDRSVIDQGFRRVDPRSLTAPMIEFGKGDPVSEALASVGSEPSWGMVGQQLASYIFAGFDGLWLRRDKQVLQVVVSYSWKAVAQLDLNDVKGYSDQCWTITNALAKWLGTFQLSGTNLEVITKAAEGVITVPAEVKPLIEMMFELHLARTPITVVLAIGLGGLQPDLINASQTLNGNPFIKYTNGVPSVRQWLGAIDGLSLEAHGQTGTGSLNLKSLTSSLQFHRKAG